MKTISTKSLVLMSVCAAAFVTFNAFADDDLFSMLDANGDGVIDAKEATAHEVLSESFATVDANADGVITREEFAALEL